MAVTKGHGNPDWTRDETLLALDLFFKLGGTVPGEHDPRVVALSGELRELPVHASTVRRESFRNPAGVAFKLQNLRAVRTGTGLKNTSAMDKAIWAEYGDKPAEVHELARSIRALVEQRVVTKEQVLALDPDEEFAEGRLLTVTHRVRERNRSLRKSLLALRAQSSTLMCDCCGDGPKSSEEDLQLAGFEAHHIVPLSQAPGPGKTKLADVALLCATCHRMIHWVIQKERRWVSVAELAARLR